MNKRKDVKSCSNSKLPKLNNLKVYYINHEHFNSKSLIHLSELFDNSTVVN